MAKNARELSQVKARQTKLGKKSKEDLIQIVLKKDKVEHRLNSQIKNLKAENNGLSTRVRNFDSDMEGTYQALEANKDQVKTLQEKNDALKIESKDNYEKYLEENKKAITLTNKLSMWKVATYIMTAIAVIAIVVAVL